VFAQAKAAAKNAASISNVTQAGLGQIMYANDNDDAFPLVTTSFPTTATDELIIPSPASCEAAGGTVINCTQYSHVGAAAQCYTWENLIQPYAKNWQMMVSPLAKLANLSAASENQFFSYGMPPRVELLTAPPATPNGGVSWKDLENCPTTVGTCYWEGIGGSIARNQVLAASGQVQNYGVAAGNAAPSLITTTVANPADMVMVCDSNMWDFGLTGAAATTVEGDTFAYVSQFFIQPSLAEFGPAVRYGQLTLADELYKFYGGNVNVSFTDGHAKGTQYMQLMTASQLQNVPNVEYVYKYMWPAGGY
jgi:prepilin-type processing-associated H-X9-DG protein